VGVQERLAERRVEFGQLAAPRPMQREAREEPAFEEGCGEARLAK
jgi:hypothetical protein